MLKTQSVLMRFFIIFSMAITNILVYGQTSSFVSASQNSHGTSVNAEWTIGELIVEGFSSPNLYVSHGLNETGVVFIITGDIQEKETINQVYPIPFQSEFFIETNDDNLKDYSLDLLDASGKSLKPQIEFISDKSVRIDTGTLAEGFYILTLKTNTSVKTFKLIKQ